MSTGCRQGEALQLKVKDIDITTSPVKVHFPAEITKTRQERIGFLTREASNALQYRLDKNPERSI
jgi:integrase